MWYPSQAQQRQQQSWYEYAHHSSSQQQQQQQQTYSKPSYYYNGDELSTTCMVTINDENESSIHCQPTYDNGNVHVTTSNYYVTTSTSAYGDEMSSYQTTSTRKPYWNPVIVAPTKSMTINTPSLPVTPSSSSSSSSSCWDWLLFSPQYYSEFYTPLSNSIHCHQQKIEEENDNDDDDKNLNFLASLPTCLLTLLYLTPKLIRTTNDENDSHQYIKSLHRTDQTLLTRKNNNNISSNLSSDNDSEQNRSSTPDTDDGYQSASDASRSDYSQQSSIPYDHHNSKGDITINEHSLPTPLMPQRISYAAAVKPIITPSSSKPKQTLSSSTTTTTGLNDMLNSNGQKLKFIAPRFERMHHAKQYSSSTISTKNSSTNSSNKTQIRSTNNNQRNHIVNPTRRR